MNLLFVVKSLFGSNLKINRKNNLKVLKVPLIFKIILEFLKDPEDIFEIYYVII